MLFKNVQVKIQFLPTPKADLVPVRDQAYNEKYLHVLQMLCTLFHK